MVFKHANNTFPTIFYCSFGIVVTGATVEHGILGSISKSELLGFYIRSLFITVLYLRAPEVWQAFGSAPDLAQVVSNCPSISLQSAHNVPTARTHLLSARGSGPRGVYHADSVWVGIYKPSIISLLV